MSTKPVSRIHLPTDTIAPPVRPVSAHAAWADQILTVGVTGTNGKTSTTLLLAHAMRAGGQRVLTESTLGYCLDDEPIDVPRTVSGFVHAFEVASARGCNHAAIEVTSEALANGFAKKWRFDHAIFTNLTRDHLDAHGSWEHYLASKSQLFVHLGPGRAAVLNACDPSCQLVDRVTPSDVHRVWYACPSRGPLLREADLAIRAVKLDGQGSEIELEPSQMADQLGGRLRVAMIGEIYAENALAAACGALAAGIDPGHVALGLARCPVIAGRFEVVERSPFVVVVDFAHSPDALARTCDTARRLAGRNRVLVVFGAGGERDQGKREPMGRAVGQRVDVAIITTDNPRKEEPGVIARAIAAGCRRGGRAHVRSIADRRSAIEHALGEARPGDVLVVAGKGHERGQAIGSEILPFSDVDCLKELLGSSIRA
jgi:UDP-N-acetylmuramoyl-L-alanyl-D-glutamate--2,6-diaminopimelate ligase